MLIQLSIKNYRSFKDNSILSLVATNYDKDTREEENVISDEQNKLRLLKSAVVYGANAGGKSKFIEALIFMRQFILSSSKDSQKGETIAVEPFRLNSETIKLGSEFEIIFTLQGERYRYGFEVNNEKIIAEWLFHKPKTKEIELFYRDYQDISTKMAKANLLVKEGLIRDNALFLSVLAQFNDKTAESILEWFKDVTAISSLQEEGYLHDTMQMTKDEVQKSRILAFLKNADIGIDDFKLKKHIYEDVNDKVGNFTDDFANMLKAVDTYTKRIFKENGVEERFSDVITFHKQYDENGAYQSDIQFSLKDDESSGTRKFFALIGLILKTIDKGSVLFVDELDAKLHPNLVCKIVSFFNSKKLNPNNAQLIFNTHDTNLLSSGLFRRDQIWFTQKDKYSATKLYSLADFRTDEVRKNEAFEDNYIRGKYGAVPFLGDFEDIIHNLTPKNGYAR
jgi:AAA15 family ATPase/GTPase